MITCTFEIVVCAPISHWKIVITLLLHNPNLLRVEFFPFKTFAVSLRPYDFPSTTTFRGLTVFLWPAANGKRSEIKRPPHTSNGDFAISVENAVRCMRVNNTVSAYGLGGIELLYYYFMISFTKLSNGLNDPMKKN